MNDQAVPKRNLILLFNFERALKYANVQKIFGEKRCPNLAMEPRGGRSGLLSTALGLHGLEYVGVELGGAPSA
jgi:hypothetical protein